EVYALDLHSTSAESTPFAMIGDTLRNRDFAKKFPATILLGIEEQLDSTILEYINNLGAVTLGFEAGQHIAQSTVLRHEALIWLALVNSGILPQSAVDVQKYKGVLSGAMGDQRLIEVRYRHAIRPADEFKMELGYENFQPVRKNEVLGTDKKGNVKAIESGLILMPLYQAQGEDGFFLGREISPFWLRLSRILRKLRLGGLIHLLPGVKKHPVDSETLIVNTAIARLLPLQIFHLLGFRKRRWRNDQLVVSRRSHDTVSPFRKK
ncbi:MAG: aspartoacylase, partial [Acidobacteria bacterium]|nr:aspartoacylase [Acidobacteriota bacterium]